MRVTSSTCLKPFSFSYVIAHSQVYPFLTSLQEIPLLSLHIPQLVQFFIQAGSNRNIDAELRVLALNALNWTVQ